MLNRDTDLAAVPASQEQGSTGASGFKVSEPDVREGPGRKPGGLPVCYFVCERDSVGRIRT